MNYHNGISRRAFLAGSATLGAAVVLHPFAVQAAAGQAHLRIMETTDLHVAVFPYDYYADAPNDTLGLARTAAIIDSIRAEAGNSILVDNGDVIQGNPMGDYIAYEKGLTNEPHPIIAAMNVLGYEAGTLGNHEFNYGLEFLDAAIVSGLNVLVSGGTQAGKTTLLNCLGSSIPGRERVISVEEVYELRFHHPDWVALQTRQQGLEGTGEVRLRDLVKESLRMRPSRIVVGEVRAEECLDLLLALNAGLPGMASLHANSAREALVKMCTLPLLAGENMQNGVGLEVGLRGARTRSDLRTRLEGPEGERHQRKQAVGAGPGLCCARGSVGCRGGPRRQQFRVTRFSRAGGLSACAGTHSPGRCRPTDPLGGLALKPRPRRVHGFGQRLR